MEIKPAISMIDLRLCEYAQKQNVWKISIDILYDVKHDELSQPSDYNCVLQKSINKRRLLKIHYLNNL